MDVVSVNLKLNVLWDARHGLRLSYPMCCILALSTPDDISDDIYRLGDSFGRDSALHGIMQCDYFFGILNSVILARDARRALMFIRRNADASSKFVSAIGCMISGSIARRIREVYRGLRNYKYVAHSVMSSRLYG